MNPRIKMLLWWCAVAVMTLTAAMASPLVWRHEGGLATLSEVAYLERIEGTFAAGKAPIEKNELNPLARYLVRLATTEREEAQRLTGITNGVATAVLMLLFLLVVVRFVPWWLALAAGGGWLFAPVVAGQMSAGTPGMVSLLFLLGPSLGLVLALSCGRLWLRLACVAAAGVAAGAGVFAHPLALWVSLSLLLTLFATRPQAGGQEGVLVLPPLGGELLALLGGLLLGFVGFKSLLHLTGGDLLAYLFGFLDGPHPPFAFLGDLYRGGEMGGPPWYASLWLFVVRQPLPVLVLGGVAVGLLISGLRKAPSGLRTAWPFWGATLVITLCACLQGSPVVPAGLGLLVVLTPAWMALVVWGIWQLWGRVPAERRVWLYAGRTLLVLATLALPLGGAAAALRAYPMPGAYANALAMGTRFFVAQGHDPMGELAVPVAVLQDLVDTKQREVVGYPSAKGLQRLVGLLPGEPKLKIREGGPFPVFQVFAPVSPRTELLPSWAEPPESGWAVEVDGWPMFRYWR